MHRLLILDNDDHHNQRLQKIFSFGGIYVFGTWSGREALGLLHSSVFHVLLTSDYLPDIHAGEFLRHVSRLPSGPRVVVMRGSSGNLRKVCRDKSLNIHTIVDKHRTDLILAAVSASPRSSSAYA